ncbi:hypothetical protein BG006_000766 [Podila minutissima]|uniref:Uncharacterized protein n=1 Tax=Podila minutissima TaxID=64525 RepID=A0A9P5SEV8_9FUNG|nr:hypothetical protein BG006_000766 [Podila minutissima]
MIFARTLVVLCVAAVAMARVCDSQESFDSEWWGPRRGRVAYMMEGQHEIWTKNTCSSIGKEIKWCYNEAQDYCETGNKATEFRNRCSERGSDCYAVDC